MAKAGWPKPGGQVKATGLLKNAGAVESGDGAESRDLGSLACFTALAGGHEMLVCGLSLLPPEGRRLPPILCFQSVPRGGEGFLRCPHNLCCKES